MTRSVGVLAAAILCSACSGAGDKAAASTEATAAVATGTAPAAESNANTAAAVPTFREITIPAGTALRLDLKTGVSSDGSQVEDTVRATLRQTVRVDGDAVLPVGTELVGAVTEVARSGRVKGRARVAYRFTSLRLLDERYDIRTALLAHEAEATKGADAKKVAIGAGAGAAVGALLGGGSGAAKGAAIGGAGGTGVVLATRGKEIRLGPGADVTTRLTEPLTVRTKN